MRKILSAALALLLVLSSVTGTVLFEHVHANAADDLIAAPEGYKTSWEWDCKNTAMTGWLCLNSADVASLPATTFAEKLRQDGAILLVKVGDGAVLRWFGAQDSAGIYRLSADQVQAEDVGAGTWDKATGIFMADHENAVKLALDSYWNIVCSGEGTITAVSICVPDTAEPDPEPEGVLVTLIKDGKSVAGGDFSGPKIGWGTKIIDNTSAEWADFVKAVNNKDAKFVLKYTVTGEVANEEYGWWNILQVDTPKGGLGHITIANHSGEAAKFVDTLDGKVMSNQWSLLHIGEHVVTYSAADFANLLATHTCTHEDTDNPDNSYAHEAGDTAVEKITALFSQSGLADTLSVSVSSLVIEGPETGTPEPEDKPDTGDHPKGEKEIAVDGVDYPLNDGGAHTYAITGQELGKTVTVHLVGTTGGDFRVWLSHGDWDRMSEIKTVSYDTLEDGKFDVTYELTVADADSKNVDIASHVQVKGPSGGSLKDFTLTHLGVVYPAAEAVDHPEGEKEVEITDKTVSKLGANEVVIADGSVTSSANQFAILLPEAANVKDKITVHVKGTTTGDFRMWAGHEDGAYTMSPDPAWKASERGITVPTPDGEEFDFTYTLTVNDKDTVGCSEADCIIFKAPSYNESLKDLKITHFGYTIEKYYAEPAGYVEDATLTEATVEEADGNVVITPEGDVTTEGLLISLEEPAAADGKVTVSYGAEPRADGKTDDDGDGYIEEFAWSGEFLMHEWHNVKDIIGESSLSDFITAINLSGAVLEVSFENDSQYGNMTNVVFAWGGPSMSLGNYPVGKQTLKKPVADSGATPGSIAECIFQFDIYQHSEVDVKITGIKVYSPVPETPEDIVVEFKAGDMYIEVPTSAAKKSAIKSITIEPATAVGGKDNVAAVKVKKPKDETKALASLNGYAIQLGEDYHGFLFMGHMITMPHTFGADNICTACDYERIVVEEGDSDKPAKPKLTTLDQGDACVIDISNLGLKSGDTVHISIAGTVNTSVSALRLFLATEGVFNNNASDIVNAELDGSSFTYEGDLTAQGSIMYIYIKSQAGGPALHPSDFDFTVFTAEKK